MVAGDRNDAFTRVAIEFLDHTVTEAVPAVAELQPAADLHGSGQRIE